LSGAESPRVHGRAFSLIADQVDKIVQYFSTRARNFACMIIWFLATPGHCWPSDCRQAHRKFGRWPSAGLVKNASGPLSRHGS
jgi:hypothetical protein